MRGIVQPFGRGQRRGHAGPVVSRSRRRARGAVPRPASAPASTATAAPSPANGTGTMPPRRASDSAASAATARPMTHTATSRPAMDWICALVSRWATIQRRTGTPPRVAIRLASSRAAPPSGSQPRPIPTASTREQQQPPGEHQGRRPSRAPVRR